MVFKENGIETIRISLKEADEFYNSLPKLLCE